VAFDNANQTMGKLAYLSGVLMGDGSIFVREYKHDYCIKCVGNPKDEIKFYD